MEDFISKTRGTYKMNECKIYDNDCRYEWKLSGTLHGMCLTLNPANFGPKFPRDAEFRIDAVF